MSSSSSQHNIPLQMLKHLQYLRNLHQQGPRIGNTYLEDSALQQYTQNIIGKNQKFKEQLTRLGDRFSSIYLQSARDAQNNHPRLEQFDSYGKRIDKLHLSEGWKNIAKMSAQDGIVALAYEQDKFDLKQYQRYGQMVALTMYHPSSGLYGCPLAMTDGAAYTLRGILENVNKRKVYLEDAYNHLISRTDPWTSGQWMTQKKGGSDVSNTQTVAVKQRNSEIYRLYGYKWFTSATDSQMTLALAKILPQGAQPTVQALKAAKVSLFFLKMRNNNNELNNMEIIRLKDKMGTRQLPTAQILLKGSQAYLISPQGFGVKQISKMLTVTRLYNSATAVGSMRRIIALLRDYSNRRIIGNQRLRQLPLQLRVLSDLQVTYRGNLIFYLTISKLFSKEHAKSINPDEANVLRIMSPLLKLFTGKQAMQVLSEGLQGFGGLGFIEGTMIPTLYRDVQVLSIWQGTTNVLCYDFVRALSKKQNSYWPLESLGKYCMKIIHQVHSKNLLDKTFIQAAEVILMNYNSLISDLYQYIKKQFKGVVQDDFKQTSPMSQLRTLAFATSRIFIGILLIDHCLMTRREKDYEITKRWVQQTPLYKKENYDFKLDKQIGLDIHPKHKFNQIENTDSRGKIRPRF